MRRWVVVVTILLVVVLGAWWRLGRSAPAEATTATTFIEALGGSAESGYARATEPNAIVFPRDLAAHPDYQTEWWYYTGNLADADGRAYGFQFTIFRRALTPPDAAPTRDEATSDWRTNQVYFAHFTVSDLDGGQFYFSERYSRGAAGLAGAQAEPYRVWIDDWQVTEQPDGTHRIQAQADGYALDLTLTQTLPPVLHGDGGLSAKSSEPGNASYYYSLVQQRAAGTVTIGTTTTAVTGKAWKDHEWSTSVLGDGAVGWDWLSLQFDDGTALMLFEIRQADGGVEPMSSGSWIAADGAVTPLAFGDWSLNVTERWRSPATGASYPVAWQLAVPSLGLELTGRAQMPNQELTFSSGAYWEGAVRFDGTRAGATAAAAGYMEMTGYDGEQ